MDQAAFEYEIERLCTGEGLAAVLFNTLLQLNSKPHSRVYEDLPDMGYAEDTRLTSAQVATLVERLHAATEALGPELPVNVVPLYTYTGDDRTAGYVIALIYRILDDPGPDANGQLNQLLTALTVHADHPGVNDAITAVAQATNLPTSHLGDAREDARTIISIWKKNGRWPGHGYRRWWRRFR